MVPKPARAPKKEMPYPLCDGCRSLQGKMVLGHGPPQTKWAIVGESPSWDEVRQGQPFVGPAGQILNKVLRELGIPREEVYFTNAAKCVLTSGLSAQDKAKSAALCAKAAGLIDELQQHGVQYVLALGNVAMFVLYGEGSGITRSRGTPRTHPAGFKVMPAIHPASWLHRAATPQEQDDFYADVLGWWNGCVPRSAVQVFRSYQVIKDPVEGRDFVRGLKGNRYVVIDLETSGFSLDYDEILCAVISRGPDDATILTDDVLYEPIVSDAFNALPKSITWIGHNLAFDLLRLEWYLDVHLRAGFDTMLAHYALDETRGTHGLKALAAHLLGAPDWEADLKTYLRRKDTSYGMLPPEILWRYCANDGIFTYQLFELFSTELDKQENRDLKRLFYETLMPTSELTRIMERNGIRVDPDRIRTLRAECSTFADKAHGELCRIAEDPNFNPRSYKQVAHVLYDKLQAPGYSRSGKGLVSQLGQATGKVDEYSTGKEQLERLTHWDQELPLVAEFAQNILAYRGHHYTISHYLEPFMTERAEDGRLHTQFLIHGTATGRLATTKPNILNMSRDTGVRWLVAPESGNVLVSADYSQHEIRCMAMLSRDTILQELFHRGVDIHDMVATWFYGPDYSKTQRVIAKAFVFGVMYGRGARSIAFGFGIPLEEAYEKMNILFSQMPRLRSWANHELRRDILTKGYVSTPLGRRRRFAMATADNYGAIRRFVVNSPIQGTASDILMLAMRNIQRWAPDYGAKLLFPLHDAVNLEVPEEHLHEVAMRTVWEMWQAPQQVFGPDCIPFKVDIDYGVSLQEDVRDPATGELTIQGDLHKLQYTTDEVNEVIERVAPQEY